MTHLLIAVHWLDDRYHGLLDREGPPEWPPSPYRLFQALVAGAARRGELEAETGMALDSVAEAQPSDDHRSSVSSWASRHPLCSE